MVPVQQLHVRVLAVVVLGAHSRAQPVVPSSSSPRSSVALRPAAAAPRCSPRRQLPVVVRWYVLVARLVVVHPLRPTPQRIFKSPLAAYPAPRRSRAACRRLLMRPPPAPCCAACCPCCRAARSPAAAAALHPRPAAAPPPIAIIAADIQKFSERKNRARSNCRALDCYCMGVVSIQSKRATWTRFSLQPSTNPGGQSRKPVEALLWTPPG